MGKSVTYLTGTNLWQKLHLVMGKGETARTEIADRELASTRERPASRDESHKHNTRGRWWHNPNMPKEENVAHGAKGGGVGKRSRTGALGPGPIRGHSPQMGQGAATDGAPTRHPPWGDGGDGSLLVRSV